MKKTNWFIKDTKIFPILNLLKFLLTFNDINEHEKIQSCCFMQHGFCNYLICTRVSKRSLLLHLTEMLLKIHNMDSV